MLPFESRHFLDKNIKEMDYKREWLARFWRSLKLKQHYNTPTLSLIVPEKISANHNTHKILSGNCCLLLLNIKINYRRLREQTRRVPYQIKDQKYHYYTRSMLNCDLFECHSSLTFSRAVWYSREPLGAIRFLRDTQWQQ